MTEHPNSLGTFEDVVWPLRTRVLKIIRAWSPRRNDYEDILSETMRKAWKAWPRFVPLNAENPDQNIVNWLIIIAKNELINQSRAQSLRSASSLDKMELWQVEKNTNAAVNVDFDAQIHDAELSEMFREALMKIPGAFREVCYLVIVEELSYLETAEVLQIPLGTVMSRLSRGREALRSVINREELAA